MSIPYTEEKKQEYSHDEESKSLDVEYDAKFEAATMYVPLFFSSLAWRRC